MLVGVGEAKVATKVVSTSMDVAQVADKAVYLGKYQANLKGLGKKLAQNIDDGILTQGRAFSDSIDNLISAMNKHTSTPYPAYAGLGKLDDVGKTADKFEDWYSSVKKSMMKTDSTGGSGVKVSGPVDELNPKALNEAGEQIAKGTGKALPQGISREVFDTAGKIIKDKVGNISDNIVVQGSRASGTAKATSDIDIAIRVSPEKFNELVNEKFKIPNPGSAKEKTMLHAIDTGKIQAGEAGLRSLRKELEEVFGMEVDISIIEIGGPFDNPPFIELP